MIKTIAVVYYGVVEVIIGVGPKVGQFVVGFVQLVHYRVQGMNVGSGAPKCWTIHYEASSR